MWRVFVLIIKIQKVANLLFLISLGKEGAIAYIYIFKLKKHLYLQIRSTIDFVHIT